MKVKGTGSIKQVKNKGVPVKNSWQLVLSLGVDPLTGKRVQKYRHFSGTKTDARRALAEFKREIETGLKLNADTVVFGDYAKQWEESRKLSGRLTESTIARGKYNLRHLNRHLATVKLKDIEPTTIRNLYIALAHEGIGQNSIAKAAITLKQILRQACADGVVLRNVCDFVEAPKMPKSKKGTALSNADIARLAKALKDAESNYYPLAQIGQQRLTIDMSHASAVRLALTTGLRRGEVLALRWCDIDFDDAALHVRHTLCRTTKLLKLPKTHGSIRTVSLDDRTIADIKRWKNRQAQYLFSIGIKQDEQTHVICSEVGGYMDADNLNRWWKAFKKQYGFDGLRFHDLRHCHASMLVGSGVNFKVVSERLGHSNIGTTLNLYSHVLRENDKKAANIVGEIMGQSASL